MFILSFSYLLLACFNVILAGIYNYANGMIFEGLELRDESSFLAGLYLYFFVAIATGLTLSAESYLVQVFALKCVKVLSSPEKKQQSIYIKQFGERVIDDGQLYYHESLCKAGDFLQNLLRCVYFSYLTLSLIDQNHLYNFKFIIVLTFAVTLSCSLILLIFLSGYLKYLRVYFEKNLSQYRSYLNFGLLRHQRRHKSLLNRYYYSGKKLAFYESMSLILISMGNYFPYFFPLIIFSSSILKGDLSISQYVRISGAITAVLQSLIWFSRNTQALAAVRAARARILSLLC